MLMYCLKFMLKIYICKYCEIGSCDDDMYLHRYVGVQNIYLSHTANLLYSTCFCFCQKFYVAWYEFFLLYNVLLDVT